MKKRLIYILFAILVIGGTFASKADDSKQVTVTGEVIDQVCFANKDGARGEEHKGCALACAKRGNQMAIIDDSNEVYLISGDYAANKNEKLIPYVAEKVEVSGTLTEKEGKKWLSITSIKKAE